MVISDYQDDLTTTSRTEDYEWTARISTGLAFARGHALRMREIERLKRLSDPELEELGITRDEITRFVWRDRIEKH